MQKVYFSGHAIAKDDCFLHPKKIQALSETKLLGKERSQFSWKGQFSKKASKNSSYLLALLANFTGGQPIEQKEVRSKDSNTVEGAMEKSTMIYYPN